MSSPTLFLQGTALNEERLSQPMLGRFDERGGSIGRSDNATFTLPDPERRISRIQAKVHFDGEGYWIENASAASPLLHNGRLLGDGMRVLLHDRDELRIGGYTLSVSFEDDASSAAILRGRTVVPGYESGHTAPRMTPVPMRTPPTTFRAVPSTPSVAATASHVVPQFGAATPRAVAPSVSGSVDSLWQAFLDGAGIEFSASTKPSLELMSAIGAMLSIAVGGVHRLVALRALAKDEMHTELTMIQGHDNNPLKFAPDAASALQMLMQPAARGFLDGPAALRAAFIDLQSHQVGMVAGMRSAVEAGLDRFDPTKLEAQLTARWVFDSLLPAHRRARLWELYLEHYRSLREEAQDDFHRFFGETFREAYEAQVRNLEADEESSLPTKPGTRKGPR